LSSEKVEWKKNQEALKKAVEKAKAEGTYIWSAQGRGTNGKTYHVIITKKGTEQ